MRKPDAPSIPAQAQAYGYEETEEGVLRKQEPPLQDKTIGPAFYQKVKGRGEGLLIMARVNTFLPL